MSSAPAKPADLVTVNIDGRDIAVPKGTNVIEAAKLLGMSFRAYRYWLQELGGPEALGSAFPRPEDFPPRPTAEGEGDA